MGEPTMTCPCCTTPTCIEQLPRPVGLRITCTVCPACGWDDLPRPATISLRAAVAQVQGRRA